MHTCVHINNTHTRQTNPVFIIVALAPSTMPSTQPRFNRSLSVRQRNEGWTKESNRTGAEGLIGAVVPFSPPSCPQSGWDPWGPSETQPHPEPHCWWAGSRASLCCLIQQHRSCGYQHMACDYSKLRCAAQQTRTLPRGLGTQKGEGEIAPRRFLLEAC